MATKVGFIRAIGIVMLPKPKMIAMLEKKFNIKAVLKKTIKEELK